MPSTAHSLPALLTFNDIQNMSYLRLNKAGGNTNRENEFRPQDFLDIDSGDSDNEILANFKSNMVPSSINSFIDTPQTKIVA